MPRRQNLAQKLAVLCDLPLLTVGGEMKSKKIILLVLSIICLAVVFGYLKRQLAIDKCLDNGGRWNYEKNTCEYSNIKTN